MLLYQIFETWYHFLGHLVVQRLALILTSTNIRFIYDRPFHKGAQDPENEFSSLWIERTVYTSNSEFPGILKWFEVVEKNVSFVSPLQFACETMATKNDELKQFVREYSSDRYDLLHATL